jgi:hypothetical protein
MTEAFPWETAPRYLLRDRDASYGQGFRDRIHAMGIKDVVTAPRPRLTRIARKLAPYTPRTAGTVIAFPVLGGLHHRYERRAA